MGARLTVLVLILGAVSGFTSEAAGTPETAAVDTVLTAFHAAAAEADGETYLGLLADDAVFIGTDPSERWTADEFAAFASPYFAEGRGWTYTASDRHIRIAPGGSVAWFDEMLWNDAYGICRGTGVLLLTENGWRIVQYHLTFPIPNELSRELTTRIREHSSRSAD